MIRKLITTALMLIVGLGAAYAQEPATVYLNNGNVLRGRIVSESGGKIVIRTDNGADHTYLRSEIRKIDNATPTVPEYGVNKPAEGYYNDLSQLDKGFYFAAESTTGFSIRPGKRNFGYEEIDLIGGYRFSTCLRAGIGFGARYYWNNKNVRRHYNRSWTMPLLVDLRGEFMQRAYRTVVPYWSLQTGTNLGDGFMLRPSVGMRIGERRSAFLVALAYTGQSMRISSTQSFTTDDGFVITEYVGKRKFESFISIKLGYEF